GPVGAEDGHDLTLLHLGGYPAQHHATAEDDHRGIQFGDGRRSALRARERRRAVGRRPVGGYGGLGGAGPPASLLIGPIAVQAARAAVQRRVAGRRAALGVAARSVPDRAPGLLLGWAGVAQQGPRAFRRAPRLARMTLKQSSRLGSLIPSRGSSTAVVAPVSRAIVSARSGLTNVSKKIVVMPRSSTSR